VRSLAQSPPCHLWLTEPVTGHEIIATIAQLHLDPQVLTAVCSILASDDEVRPDPPCYLSTVATWADKIHFRNQWSVPLHYIGATGDHPPDNCLFPGPDGWEGKERANVLDAIHNVSSILTDFVQGPSSSSATAAGAPQLAQEALKFLIHFVGDVRIAPEVIENMHTVGHLTWNFGTRRPALAICSRVAAVHETPTTASHPECTPRYGNGVAPLPPHKLPLMMRIWICDGRGRGGE
jgi:hypothetical protein